MFFWIILLLACIANLAVKKQLKHEYIAILNGIIEIMHIYPEFVGLIFISFGGKQATITTTTKTTVKDFNDNRCVRTEAHFQV